MMVKTRAGFTLIEVMVTVAIILIMAAVAIPQYGRVVERHYWRQAQDLLLTIYSGERAYSFVNSSKYLPVPAGSLMATWRTIFMDDPQIGAVPPINYVVTTAAGNTTFVATATRNDGSGRNITINQNRVVNTGAWPQP